MALKITSAYEPLKVAAICTTIYSQPGLGKTSLAFTASNPLLFDFDHGAYRAVSRKDTVQVTDWEDVANVRAEDLEPYDTIVLDTVGKALDALANDIIRKNPKMGYSGALNQQGWGQLGVRFSAFLRKMKGFGKDIVLLSHMDEKADGDSIKERLKISGGSKDLVLTDSDMIARISIHHKERLLVFSPTETSFGKDPASFGEIPIPGSESPKFSGFLAEVIASTKASLNAMSEEQTKHQVEVEWFENTLVDVTTPDQLNDLLGRAKQAGRDVSKMIVD
ncbi:MAG: ATP-binding protein, partial [Pseudomonadota bacterium]